MLCSVKMRYDCTRYMQVDHNFTYAVFALMSSIFRLGVLLSPAVPHLLTPMICCRQHSSECYQCRPTSSYTIHHDNAIVYDLNLFAGKTAWVVSRFLPSPTMHVLRSESKFLLNVGVLRVVEYALGGARTPVLANGDNPAPGCG